MLLLILAIAGCDAPRATEADLAARIAPGTPAEPVPDDPARAALARYLPERADDPRFRALVDEAMRSSRGRRIAERGEASFEDLEDIRERVLDRGMPELFAAIPYWESYLDDEAVSRSCAGGAWQLMPATATDLDLVVAFCEFEDGCARRCRVDERKDRKLATEAAIELLARSWNAPGVAGDPDRTGLTVLAYHIGLGAARIAAGDGDPWDELPPVAELYVPGVIASMALATCGAARVPHSRFGDLERSGLCRSLDLAGLLPDGDDGAVASAD